MPSLVTKNSDLSRQHRRGAVGRALAEMPNHVLASAPAVAARPNRQHRLPHPLRCEDHPLARHRAGDRAAADQAGQLPADLAGGRLVGVEHLPAEHDQFQPARRCARGSASCTSRSSRAWPTSSASSSNVRCRCERRGRPRSSARACPASRRTSPECRSRSPDRRRARGCWRGPTRPCSRRTPSADCDARADCRRNRRPPNRRCRNARRRGGRRSPAKGWRSCATARRTDAAAFRPISLAAVDAGRPPRHLAGPFDRGPSSCRSSAAAASRCRPAWSRKMLFSQMAGVLLPHSGSGHSPRDAQRLVPNDGQIGLAARAVAVRPAPLRPIVGPRRRTRRRQRMHESEQTARSSPRDHRESHVAGRPNAPATRASARDVARRDEPSGSQRCDRRGGSGCSADVQVGCDSLAPIILRRRLGNQQRHFQRLLVVQTRVHVAAIGAAQVRLAQPAGAADALGDVLAGQLEMHAAEHRAQPAVNLERGARVRRGCRRSRGFSRRFASAACCRASGRNTRARSARDAEPLRPAAADTPRSGRRRSDGSTSAGPVRFRDSERRPDRSVARASSSGRPSARSDWRCRGSIRRGRRPTARVRSPSQGKCVVRLYHLPPGGACRVCACS